MSSGLEIVPSATFAEALPADTLVVPGGIGASRAALDPVYIEYVRKRSRQVKRILSVCHGAFILAEAGLLEGKAATTHWLAAADFAKR